MFAALLMGLWRFSTRN